MSINENNITDIEDSALLANTPMIMVEQRGKSFAMPINVQTINATKEIAVDGTEVVISRTQPFMLYRCGVITSLTVESTANNADDTTIIFTTGDTFTASFPSTIAWLNEMDFKIHTKYVIAICAELAVGAEVLQNG